ncbi:alkyl sulfatase dimerization domain-containing protein [Microbacterium aurugineum]|uniref:alkyl/aryl-sulfatase n=1 Tax=Microbacterium TaxID=33882 RepID=UPI0021155286|nr:alkyl sulfatase dimerization domain-containing protein [Microbacterium sp. J1-1]UUE21309.1 MBL fold metallo-hydrolase [Microbacterium sp. J1-1]
MDATTPKPATDATRKANAEAAKHLPWDDRQDFDDVARGFIAPLADPVVRKESGAPVINLAAWDFVKESDDAPDTVHPSLWRHAQVNSGRGLFEVTDGIYQLRGIDLSNMTIVEGDEGIIVIDPLVGNETAAAGLALYREHRGVRPVKALIYTHSHADHYGGSRAIVSDDDIAAGRTVVIAPDGFLSEAVSENVYAGTAMTRRALYMYGPLLPIGERGQIDAGLSSGGGAGFSSSLVPPTDTIATTGETRVVDGVEMVFQMAPGTEAPSEFLIYFPAHRALCTAEDATHVMHNLLTLRGAQVRDAATWWKTLNETIHLFGADTDVVFAQHNWPRWGTESIIEFLANQRDLYKYIHDQVLRLTNLGQTPVEIAEQMELPAALDQQWYNRGYYGSLNHNSKAVYQRYIGWYDSHPAHLHPLPPTEVGARYVEFMGGADAVVEKAKASFDKGDYRWVADVLTHVVFSEPDHQAARELQADAFEQLGYQSENPTWRNEYLMAALELRNGVRDLGTLSLATLDVLNSMTPEMIFDFMGIKLDGPAAADRRSTLDWVISDAGADGVTYALELRNGCLIYTPNTTSATADATVTSTKSELAALVFGSTDLDTALSDGSASVEGDPAAVRTLFGLLTAFPLWFHIVEP